MMHMNLSQALGALSALKSADWLALLGLALQLVGGATVLWSAVMGGVPRLVAKAMPLIIRGVDLMSGLLKAWLGGHPKVRAAMAANLPQILALMQSVSDGVKELVDAAQAEAAKDLEADVQEAPAAPAPAAPAPAAPAPAAPAPAQQAPAQQAPAQQAPPSGS